MASCERKEIIVTGDLSCDVSENDTSVNSDPITSCFNLFQMTQLIHSNYNRSHLQLPPRAHKRLWCLISSNK